MKEKKGLALSGALYPTDFVSVGSDENRMREIETVQNKDIEQINKLRTEYRNWILESGVPDFGKLEKEAEYGKSLLQTNIEKNNIRKNKPSIVGTSLSFIAIGVSYLTLLVKLEMDRQQPPNTFDAFWCISMFLVMALVSILVVMLVVRQTRTGERIDAKQLECLTALQCFDIFKSALEDVRAERIA